MYYPLKIDRIAEKEFLATCRVIPECKYMADNEAELIKTGVAALSKTLELLYRRKKKPMPLPDGSLLAGEIKIFLPIKMQFKIMLWNELIARGITLSTLARQLKMTPSQAQRLVDLTQDRVSTDSLESVLSRIGVRVTASEDRW